MRPRVIAEVIALPFLSLCAYLLWYEGFRQDGIAFCDSLVPAPLGLLLFLGPAVEIVRVADPKRVTGRAVLLGAAVAVVAAILVGAAAVHLALGRSCFE